MARVWAAECDSRTDLSSLATTTTGIGFARFGGVTVVHLRGPATQATPMLCPPDSEFFGVDFRLGTFLPMFPPASMINFQDAVLPTLPDGRILLDNQEWEMPTPHNLDVFVDRLLRAGLLIFDPLVEQLRYETVLPERTAQARFVQATGLSRRSMRVVERARDAARMLRDGASIGEVVFRAGYHDQPHLTRSLRRFIGHTPAEVARGLVFLDL